ncbi:MAG: C40 family peptidase, partial [Ilumatobacteraceae bacterium]
GKPYQFGAVGPDAYDCSGLVRAAYRQIGISLPHSSYWQSFRGTAVDWRNETIQPGDLVFTYSSANPTQISHVGIAISDSQWIEAPYTGANVRITRMPSDSRIQEVRRIVTG